MHGYPDWPISSIPTIQPSLESTTSLSSDDTSNDVQESETTEKPTSKKSPVVLPYNKGVSEQIRRVFKQYDSLPRKKLGAVTNSPLSETMC